MAGSPADPSTLTVRPLASETWPAFADLVERNNGIWGGCWCTWFHTVAAEKTYSAESNRALKERLVHEGRAHAALVLDGARAVGWCQFGPPAELPNIYHRKEYEAGLTRPPDFRITCFYIEAGYRRAGVARLALRGALELIGQAGGGRVEAYPHDTSGSRKPASFLYSATRTMFEKEGFTFERRKGKANTVMVRTVAPAG
jgi:ribosomal protein S18 acetylase RimI-like enzyme